MENQHYENMNCDNQTPSFEQIEQKGTQKLSAFNHINRLQHTNMKSDSFIMDMERFTHLTDKDVTLNSRITLQRSLSRKGSQRGGVEKKISSNIDNERDPSVAAVASSPRGSVVGATTPEKPMVVSVGPNDHQLNPQLYHQITITTGKVGATTTTPTAESKLSRKRFSFRRSSHSWTIDPRRILLLFATLSSMGTILLIYFTLSVGKPNGDD